MVVFVDHHCQCGAGRTAERTRIGRTERQHQNIVEIQRAYQPEFEAILTNSKPIEQALADAHERIQSILDRTA